MIDVGVGNIVEEELVDVRRRTSKEGDAVIGDFCVLLLGREVKECIREEVGDFRVEEDLRAFVEDEVLVFFVLDIVEDRGLLGFFVLVRITELVGLVPEDEIFEVEDAGLSVEEVLNFEPDTVARRLDVAAAF